MVVSASCPITGNSLESSPLLLQRKPSLQKPAAPCVRVFDGAHEVDFEAFHQTVSTQVRHGSYGAPGARRLQNPKSRKEQVLNSIKMGILKRKSHFGVPGRGSSLEEVCRLAVRRSWGKLRDGAVPNPAKATGRAGAGATAHVAQTPQQGPNLPSAMCPDLMAQIQRELENGAHSFAVSGK